MTYTQGEICGISEEITRINIDLNQAMNYVHRHDENSAVNNLKAVIISLERLVSQVSK